MTSDLSSERNEASKWFETLRDQIVTAAKRMGQPPICPPDVSCRRQHSEPQMTALTRGVVLCL